MTKNYLQFCICILTFLCVTTSGFTQVGINTVNPATGAILDIYATNKGLSIPNVTLTSTLDNTAITPSATTGLLVYNTVTSGALPFQVTPGFYYWNGSQWLRFYNRGYGIKFDQTAQIRASNTSTDYTQITGLDTGFINVPYSGTYQIKVVTNYACGDLTSTLFEGVGQASVSLNMTTGTSGTPNKVKEKYVTSTSKRIGTRTLNNLPQNVTIIYTVDLDVLNTYRFNVTGREWSKQNVNRGWFGKDTSGYPGASSVNNGQRGSISITLLRQQ